MALTSYDDVVALTLSPHMAVAHDAASESHTGRTGPVLVIFH